MQGMMGELDERKTKCLREDGGPGRNNIYLELVETCQDRVTDSDIGPPTTLYSILYSPFGNNSINNAPSSGLSRG
jgi:hypothetical protein